MTAFAEGENEDARVFCGGLKIADENATCLVVGLLQRQCLVVDEPARTGEADHMAPLLAVGPKFVFERLKALHDSHFTWVHARQQRHLPRYTQSFADARTLDLRDEMFNRAILQGLPRIQIKRLIVTGSPSDSSPCDGKALGSSVLC
jgi:hypothetical protein